MTKDKWIWIPHAGHLCIGHLCRFKLNTYVGKYIVSTVGEYIPDNEVIDIIKPEFKHLRGDEKEHAFIRKYQAEEIGCDRKFETMVFEARKSKHKCCPYEIMVEKEVDMNGYNSAEDAYNGHLKMCKKWSN